MLKNLIALELMEEIHAIRHNNLHNFFKSYSSRSHITPR